jgi:hypothetical protein
LAVLQQRRSRFLARGACAGRRGRRCYDRSARRGRAVAQTCDIRRAMINGAHVIIQSKKPDADRAFFQKILGLDHVDVGGGWLIFGLPPSEVAVHPSDKNSAHELYLMCEDVADFVKAMGSKKIACSAINDEGWGLVTTLKLPGGGKLGVYEPRHARPGMEPKKAEPKQAAPAKASKKSARKPVATKAAPKKAAPKQTAAKKTAPKKAPARRKA